MKYVVLCPAECWMFDDDGRRLPPTMLANSLSRPFQVSAGSLFSSPTNLKRQTRRCLSSSCVRFTRSSWAHSTLARWPNTINITQCIAGAFFRGLFSTNPRTSSRWGMSERTNETSGALEDEQTSLELCCVNFRFAQRAIRWPTPMCAATNALCGLSSILQTCALGQRLGRMAFSGAEVHTSPRLATFATPLHLVLVCLYWRAFACARSKTRLISVSERLKSILLT